jgi:hypothetical protein
MGNDTHGYGSVTVGSTFQIPTDGQWHFIGFAWDFAAGQYVVQMDANKLTGVSTFFATNGWNDTSLLAPTDAQLIANGGTTNFSFNTHIPMSDVIIDAGNPNEVDALEFLPQSYFGETAQLTPSAVQDTATNSAALDAEADPSVIRNVVTLKFLDTRVDTKQQPVLQYLTAIDIPPGTTLLTMPLDVPAVEIHGAAQPTNAEYQIINLTSAQITTGPLPLAHYITVNNAADGSGVVLNEMYLKASFESTSAQSVVLRVVNFTGKTLYLVNGGDQIPYINILGYGLRQADAYTTVRDDASVLLRTERSLDADFNWLQDRSTATDIASQLVSSLARPRPQVALTCIADPRRKPGQLVTIQDASGTRVSGTWRVLTVVHSADGPSYTQTITAVQVLPVAVWDGLNGWDNGVWS